MNLEVELLRTELDELRHTLDRMRGHRSRPWLFGLLAVGFVLGLIAARWPSNAAHAVTQEKEKENKELVCSSLKVVGPGGKNLVTLGADEDGGVVQILGLDGKVRVHLAVAPKQGPGLIELLDTKKQKTMSLGTDEDGGIMQIYGVDGKIRTIIAVAPKQGGGLVNLFDTKKKLRLVLEGSDQGGVIEKQ